MSKWDPFVRAPVWNQEKYDEFSNEFHKIESFDVEENASKSWILKGKREEKTISLVSGRFEFRMRNSRGRRTGNHYRFQERSRNSFP